MSGRGRDQRRGDIPTVTRSIGLRLSLPGRVTLEASRPRIQLAMQIRGGHRPGEIAEIESFSRIVARSCDEVRTATVCQSLKRSCSLPRLQGDRGPVPAKLEEAVEFTAGIGNTQRASPGLARGQWIGAVEEVDGEIDAAEQGAGYGELAGSSSRLGRPGQGGSGVDLRAVALDREPHHAAVASVAKWQWRCRRLDDEVGIERAGDQK